MLDLNRLTTPPEHGDLLIEPPLAEWPELIEHNRRLLSEASVRLLDADLREVRRRTRTELGIGENESALLIGHQPEFFHAGVWAKHVVGSRMARQLGGKCINLVVDNDAPHRPFLRVPVESADGEPQIAQIRYARMPAGLAYEAFPAMDAHSVRDFEQQSREALGARFERSMMPVLFAALGRAAGTPDWVDQIVWARREVEARFDVRPDDVRVSRVWGGPLLFDMIRHARRFAACYNAALAAYRQAHGIRNSSRPIPDLHVDRQRCELPLWAYGLGEPRQRVFVEERLGRLTLWAERRGLGEWSTADFESVEASRAALEQLESAHLRPRALTLTLWARLLAADLFVHGIGGAKYDEMTDELMCRYYGLLPPEIACVSATLRLESARPAVDADDVQAAERLLRDVRWNPQRHVTDGRALLSLQLERDDQIALASQLRRENHRRRTERRAAFVAIRTLIDRIHVLRPDLLEAARSRLERLAAEGQRAAVGQEREWFFALLPLPALELLVARCDQRVKSLST